MSFEVKVKKLIPKTITVKISTEQEKFCQLYSRDHKLAGDPVACYKKCYEIEPHENEVIVKQKALALLDKPQIVERINQLIEEDGFNDVNVDKQHLFLINQHKDLNVKMKGIEHYNKLKKRTNESPVFIMPTPIMDWDDAEPKQLSKEDYKEIPNGVHENNSNQKDS